MISFRKLTSGVLIGWSSTIVSIAIGVFMSPFLIHHLGEVGYGVWVLIQSTVSYMYILDLGLRTTVIRFSAEAHAREDHQEVSRVVSAALWIRVWTGSAILVIATTISLLLPHLFRVPAQYEFAAQVALVLAGASLASTLCFSVFSAVLSGLGRFDVLGILDLARAIFTSFGLVPIILCGFGIAAMALWQFIVVLVINLATLLLCFRVYPELKCRFERPHRAILASLWSLSLYVLIYNGGGQLILYTDNLVAGAFVAAAAVSYYAVAGKMMEYVRLIAISILQYIMPLASSFSARNQHERLQQLHLRGSQAVLLVTYPILITLFLRGDTLLRLWIGAKFAAETAEILRVLTVALMLMLGNANINGMTLALDRQRTLALVTIGEGLANLVISIVLVHRMGIIGVAVGTLIPTAVTSLLFWPHYLCRLLRISTVKYILHGWLRPVAAMIPFVAATYWAGLHWSALKLASFALQTVLLLPFLALGVAIVFWNDVPKVWRLVVQRRQLGESPVNA